MLKSRRYKVANNKEYQIMLFYFRSIIKETESQSFISWTVILQISFRLHALDIPKTKATYKEHNIKYM